MKFHAIADGNGRLVAWIKAAPPTEGKPRVVMLPADPSHVLHQNIDIEEKITDRTSLAAALQKALHDRIRAGNAGPT